MGDTDAVMSILNSKASPSRPTRPIKNHRKEGDAVRWYQKVGFNLVIPEKEFIVRSPEDVIPDGVEFVFIECSLETIELPPSVTELQICIDAHVERVPAVPHLYIDGSVGTLSPGIKGISNRMGKPIPREILETATGLRGYWSWSAPVEWIPPWLEELHCKDIDLACLAGSNLRVLGITAASDLVFPPTLRSLTLHYYEGNVVLPDSLEEFEIASIQATERPVLDALPRGLVSLRIDKVSLKCPLPDTLRIFSARDSYLNGVFLPESVRVLSIDCCLGLTGYPSSPCKLSISNMRGLPPIPRTVFDASFTNCTASPNIYRDVTSLETLRLLRCDESFSRIPMCVTDLRVRKTPLTSYPMDLVSLACVKPPDFDEDLVMSKLRLDSFTDENSTDQAAQISGSTILNMKKLRWLTFSFNNF